MNFINVVNRVCLVSNFEKRTFVGVKIPFCF